VSYCTTGPIGAPTEASGLLVLPTGDPDPGRALPVVSYAHGTASARTEGPSMLTTTEGKLAPLVFAATGFAVVAPDYIGLGTSLDRHPYVHADTEAGATIDLLVAARAVAADRHRPLSGDVYVTGHSQGGHAAMAVGERLQRSAGWRLRALAPLAGPYDVSGLMLPAALDPARTDPALAPMYLAYLVTSWKPIYRLHTDPHEVFTAPYADTVEGLFDGTHDVASIRAALPARAQDLFRPEFLARLAAPSGRLAAALRDNDVCRWRPSAPVRLVAARGDRDVPFEHAEHCRQQLRSRGGDAQIVDLGATDHIGTAIAGLPVVRDWFSGLDAPTGR
jgi:acetyl esterase/lipase